jgi:hypothetical protein
MSGGRRPASGSSEAPRCCCGTTPIDASPPDIDASIQSNDDVEQIAREIAGQRGWPDDWLNAKASTFIPIAAEPLWEPLHDDATVSVWVATPGSLLAMKLRAARPARDTDDIATLMSILSITTVDEAEQVFEHYFPGELPPERAYRLLDAIIRSGIPPQPNPPTPPTFG